MADKPTEQTREELFLAWTEVHQGILVKVVNAFAGQDDRQDLLQEILVALWRAVPSFRQEAKVSTFIYRVAHNCALTWYRGRRNYGRKVELFVSHSAVQYSEHRPANDQNEELLQHLYEGIRQLPELDRSLILLYLDKVSYQEMAQILGMSESNIGVRINRIKKRLSELLKGIVHEL